MTYRGRVKNGVIVLEPPAELPEGSEVDISPISSNDSSLFDRLKSVVGTAQGLPSDFAEQHDHYIHGTPKKPNPKNNQGLRNRGK